jgi:hypothetical protein
MAWYNVAMPKSIVARPGDAVSYHAICNKTEKKTSHMGAACYHGHMAVLPNYTFDCIPCNTKTSILPADDFFLWMKFCAGFGLSPSGTIPYRKGDMNCCIIHGKDDVKHRIYAGLCCYRWAECLSPMVYEACRLIEKRPDVNFYRIFHYVTGKYVTLIGHSFTNVCAGAMSLYNAFGSAGAKTPRMDHMWGIWPKFFFGLGYNLAAKGAKSEKDKRVKNGVQPIIFNNSYTQTTIAADIQKLNICLPVKKHEDLLDDKWVDLYELAHPNKEDMKALYDRVNKEEKKAA